MSDKNQSRRTTAAIAFAGVDITSSISPYLISLTYTDNEEDEADDLQIKLQDREGIWIEKWLNDMVDAAAASVTYSNPGSKQSKPYKVTPAIGLNVRSGPGTSYSILGALPYGTTINVSEISSGWATMLYSGKTAYVCAQYIQETSKSSGASQDDSSATMTGLQIQAIFIRENWNGDGYDKLLDTGAFELDSIKASGPPSTITIKGTSLPFSAQIRQTKKSNSWESYPLSGIAKEIAESNGMACMYESASDPWYERVEQYKESDISFLSNLCHDAGISLKATNNLLVLFDQQSYEQKSSNFTVKKGDGSYIKYDLSIGTADVKYSSCRVRYVNPSSGVVVEGIAYIEDYKKDSKDNQQLEITAKVGSAWEAKELAAKRLRLHNKYSKTASFIFPGDPEKVAGVTAMLAGWGSWDGKYIVMQSKHSLSTSGYTTQVTLRRVVEGY